MTTPTAARHPAAELMARNAAVFKAAWAARRELAGPKLLADEQAFLPAALSLQETPVPPAPRRTAWVICALFSAAVAWACIGEVDIVAVAPGRIIVSDYSKTIQPLEAGVVKAIHVRDGSKVVAGQLLVSLDPTQATADSQSVREQERAARSEALRTGALLAALKAGRAPAPAGSAEDRNLLQAEWADISAKLARLDGEVQRRRAELATVRELITKLSTTVPLARQRESDFKALGDEGMVAAHAAQDRSRERIELERDLATQQARQAEAEAALNESQQARTAAAAELQRTLNERQTKATNELSQLKQQGFKTAQRVGLASLLAPVAGTVQQLAIHTTGGVVTPAQALMVIVPEGGTVTAEVAINNQDIGFVREGQLVEVKVEAFNFTRYGTVPATVARVAADAVVDEKRGAYFPLNLSFARSAIDVDGKPVRLGAGMNITAEIKTGRRRVVEYLWSPVQRVVKESFGER